jgi:segregation and condensation protein B
VNTAGVLSTLIDRKLIRVMGRKAVVGRPFLYGTTREFLERFGLNDLDDLPKVEDMAELMGFDLPDAGTAPQSALPFEPGSRDESDADEGPGTPDGGESIH